MSEYTSDAHVPHIMIAALFTEREFETVRRCCRDADASAPLRAFDSATARAEGPERAAMARVITDPTVPLPSVSKAGPPIPRIDIPDTDPAPPPSEPTRPEPRLPPHPGKGKP